MFGSYFNDSFARIDETIIDWKKEIQTLQKKFKSESSFVEKSRNKLDTPGFLSNAPVKIVKELREKVNATEKKLKALNQQIRELKKLSTWNY